MRVAYHGYCSKAAQHTEQEQPLQNNMLRRHQLNWIFEIVKLILLVFSGYLTYGFLSRFLPNPWFRVLALILYEGSLVFWHYVHHYRSETPKQHLFSKNMQRLALAAVASAAGYQLLTLVSAGFGDALPGWTHFVVEIATSAVFLLQVWSFMHWEQLSRYYQAVEHSYNRELASGQAGMISAALAQESSVKVVESDENSGAIESPSEADVATLSNEASATHRTIEKGVKLLAQSTKRAKVKDRELALEALLAARPDMSVKDLASQVGLGESAVREWKKGK
jgi:AraC-like DNA-binding protein